MEAFGGKGTGELKIDMSGSTMGINLNFKMAKFNLEKLEDSFGQKRNLGGNADMAVAITTHGKDQHQFTSGLNGTFSIRGENLIIYTMDIDKKLGTLEGKPSLGLFDMSTVFGLDAMFGGGKQQKTEQGAIKKMVSDWKITNGIADATDVAISTVKHRIALKGKLDLVNERYINVVPAVIDEKGCAKLKQTFNGPFKSPKVETRDVLQTVTTAVEKYGGLFGLKQPQKQQPAQAAKCDMFYSGSVPAPAAAAK
jgi:AsmA protein